MLRLRPGLELLYALIERLHVVAQRDDNVMSPGAVVDSKTKGFHYRDSLYASYPSREFLLRLSSSRKLVRLILTVDINCYHGAASHAPTKQNTVLCKVGGPRWKILTRVTKSFTETDT